MAGNVAAGAPPLGVEPNFDNPESLYPQIILTVALCSALTTIFVAARLFAKRSFSPWTLEDYFLITAWAGPYYVFHAGNLAYDFVFLIEGQAGVGRHIWDIRPVDAPRILKLNWIFVLVYGPAFFSAKTAVLLQLMRIFTPLKSGVIYWILSSLIWINMVFYASVEIAVIFQCTPIQKIWNPLITTGHCINLNDLLKAHSALNVLSDVVILLVPLWATWHLRMAPKHKAGITAVFATGAAAVIASIFRLVYISRFPHTSDFTYLYSQIALCSLAEIAIIILCTCFPMMPRFTHLILDRLDSSRTGSSDHSRFNNRTYHSSGKRRVKLRGSSGSKHWESGDEGLSQLQNIYAPIMDSGSKNKDAQDGGAVDGMRGIKKTVRIELISQNRSEGGDIVESVVV